MLVFCSDWPNESERAMYASLAEDQRRLIVQSAMLLLAYAIAVETSAHDADVSISGGPNDKRKK